MYANKDVYRTALMSVSVALSTLRDHGYTTDTGLEHRVVCPMASVGFWLGGQCPLAA